MIEQLLMACVGVILVALSMFAKSISYGMAPHRDKPRYPVTPRLRIALACVGLLSLGFGLAGLVRR